MPINPEQLKQLIENEIKKEVEGFKIWSDLKITPFTTALNENYATVINRSTVRLVRYEISGENEVKITSVEKKEFSPSLTGEKILKKAEKIEQEIKNEHEMISLKKEFGQ